MTIIETLEKRTKEAAAALEYARGKLKNAPDGTLKVCRINGATRYIQRCDTSDSNGKYLGENSSDVVRALEEKAYCAELEKVAAQETAELARIQKLVEKLPDYRTVFLKIPQQKRHLIEPFEAPVTEMPRNVIKNLLNKRGSGKSVDSEKCFVTRNGEKVRSKSELIIADRLKEKEIPYCYEFPKVMLDERGEYFTWHPDFKVINRRTGQVYYWEHFGLLDNAEYCAEAQFKLEVYGRNGYFPGKNLIITSESSQHLLNTEYLDRLIEEYLI